MADAALEVAAGWLVLHHVQVRVALSLASEWLVRGRVENVCRGHEITAMAAKRDALVLELPVSRVLQLDEG